MARCHTAALPLTAQTANDQMSIASTDTCTTATASAASTQESPHQVGHRSLSTGSAAKSLSLPAIRIYGPALRGVKCHQNFWTHFALHCDG